MERFEFKPTPNFRVTDIEAEIERHLVFDVDVIWEVDNWSFLENGNIEVFIRIWQVINLYLNIVLEKQDGTLDYNEFDNLQEAKAFYFNHRYEVFEIRTNCNNGYYDLVDEKIFYKKN